jgi:glucose/arabinose dehydrogenase
MGPATFLSGPQWKAWDGRLVVSIMDAGQLQILALDAAGIATSNTVASLPATRYRSLVQGSDGNLYIVTDGGEIWRVAQTMASRLRVASRRQHPVQVGQ